MLDQLSPPPGAHKKRKRVGRGEGSGTGKTCGKGQKGQRCRSGFNDKPYFEGGQMPINRRVPKRGFSNYRFRVEYEVVNVEALKRFDDGEQIDPGTMATAGLVRRGRPVKVLGDGELAIKLAVKAHRFSKSATAKIEAAGGSVETLTLSGRG